MTGPTLLDLLNPAPLPAEAPSGKQHRAVLVALLNEGTRGCTGEEVAQRAGIRYPHTATTRLEELADPERYSRPLTWHTRNKERATASGRLAHVWFLTREGHDAARIAAEGL